MFSGGGGRTNNAGRRRFCPCSCMFRWQWVDEKCVRMISRITLVDFVQNVLITHANSNPLHVCAYRTAIGTTVCSIYDVYIDKGFTQNHIKIVKFHLNISYYSCYALCSTYLCTIIRTTQYRVVY